MRVSKIDFSFLSLLCAIMIAHAAPLRSSDSVNDAFIYHDYDVKREKPAKQFPCPVRGCEGIFRSNRNLQNHFGRVHPGEHRRYPNVLKSKKSSKEGKPAPCPIQTCNSGFKRKRELRRHMKNKHTCQADLYPEIMASKSSKQGKRYICILQDCQCGYMRKYDLARHIRRHHHDLDVDLAVQDGTVVDAILDPSEINDEQVYQERQSALPVLSRAITEAFALSPRTTVSYLMDSDL